MIKEEDFANIQAAAVATAMLAVACKNLKHDGELQSYVLAAMVDTLKSNDILNPLVDLAVSYDGKVLRDKNEEAADHCE